MRSLAIQTKIAGRTRSFLEVEWIDSVVVDDADNKKG